MHLPQSLIEGHHLAGAFVPPYPERHPQKITPLAQILAMRRNLLSPFLEADFRTRRSRLSLAGHTVHVCNHPHGVRETLHRQHCTFQKKTPNQRHTLAPLIGDGLFVSDGALWAERRAIVAPLVHAAEVASFVPTFRETAMEWREDWRRAGDGATLDILFEMGELTAEIIARAIFGRKLGREYTREIIAGFAQYQRHTRVADLFSLLGMPHFLPRPLGLRAHQGRRRVHRVIDHIIALIEAGEVDENAVITRLFAARDRAGRLLSRRAIRNEAIVIFMAGHETTANTLAWAFYLLSQDRRVQDKLQAELGTVLAGRVPDHDDVAKLTYTRCIIEETLRLYPPVPLLGREASGPGTILDRKVAPGDILIVAPWLLHRNRDIWGMADAFVPERFDAAMILRPDKYAYIPFASGPRVCPGRTFAMTEAIICLATLQQAFEVRLAPGRSVEVDCQLTLRPSAPLNMTVHERTLAA